MSKLSLGFATLFVVLLISLIATQASNVEKNNVAYQPVAAEGTVAPTDCGKACGRRCAKSYAGASCFLLCDACCSRCHCVPSGTEGNNLDECPCYKNLRIPGLNVCP